MELTNVKIFRQEDIINRQINYILKCPMCKKSVHKSFIVSMTATESQIEEFLEGERMLFYHNHVLDCTGGNKNG